MQGFNPAQSDITYIPPTPPDPTPPSIFEQGMATNQQSVNLLNSLFEQRDQLRQRIRELEDQLNALTADNLSLNKRIQELLNS